MTDKKEHALVPSKLEIDTLQIMAQHLAKAGFWKDAQTPNAAMAKLLVGRDLGVAPTTALSEVHIIRGKPVLSASLLGALVKRTGKYRWKVIEHTPQVCRILFLERVEDVGWEECGISEFSMEDAKQAKLSGRDIWKMYPKNMLFARALSNAVKFFAPDAIGGGAYVDGEIEEEDIREIKDVRDVVFDVDRAAEWSVSIGAHVSKSEALTAADIVNAAGGTGRSKKIKWKQMCERVVNGKDPEVPDAEIIEMTN